MRPCPNPTPTLNPPKPSRPRGIPRRRRLWLCVPAAAALCGAAHAAGEGSPPEFPSTFLVLNGLTLVLGLVATVVWLVKASRPTPPLHRQFAELGHSHPDYVTRPELSALTDKLSQDVDRKLGDLVRRDERVDTKLDAITSKLSEGFDHVHRRIDPMAETLSATAKALELHLEDHRKEHPHGR